MQDFCLQREPWLYNNKINNMMAYTTYIKPDFVLKMHFCVCPGPVTDAATGAEKGNAKAGVRRL